MRVAASRILFASDAIVERAGGGDSIDVSPPGRYPVNSPPGCQRRHPAVRRSTIPGFSGVIPSPIWGTFIGLPTTGTRADEQRRIVIGFYEFTPKFKTAGDGTTSRGPVTVTRFTPFSDPAGYVNATYITNGPVYNRTNYYPAPAAQIAVDPSIKSRRLLTGADFDVESIARMNDGTFWVGEEFGRPAPLRRQRFLLSPGPPPILRAPRIRRTPLRTRNLPSSRDSSRYAQRRRQQAVCDHRSFDHTELDKRLLVVYEFDTQTGAVHGTTLPTPRTVHTSSPATQQFDDIFVTVT